MRDHRFLYISDKQELVEVNVLQIKAALESSVEKLEGFETVLQTDVLKFTVYPATKAILSIDKTAKIYLEGVHIGASDSKNGEISHWTAIAAQNRKAVIASTANNPAKGSRKYTNYELFSILAAESQQPSLLPHSDLQVDWKNDEDEVSRIHLAAFKNVFLVVGIRSFGFFDLIGVKGKSLHMLLPKCEGIVTSKTGLPAHAAQIICGSFLQGSSVCRKLILYGGDGAICEIKIR